MADSEISRRTGARRNATPAAVQMHATGDESGDAPCNSRRTRRQRGTPRQLPCAPTKADPHPRSGDRRKPDEAPSDNEAVFLIHWAGSHAEVRIATVKAGDIEASSCSPLVTPRKLASHLPDRELPGVARPRHARVRAMRNHLGLPEIDLSNRTERRSAR